ncbi:hypothetical protein HYH02_015258 [Chlamydomonas schloesseri]|uniref:Uncharacterized protein n=1 Tax=Chlamydomonas schloesseri TaxID=2026947 RepID=A0A835SKB0_9CHLO|nr:hypothetical protein HYH02_015258 [Chlamydomonas schloesseri]|eukprot:KAG2423919.1 hypothetical protein HYH02_015258 [Chlamydomonas schloesseri]
MAQTTRRCPGPAFVVGLTATLALLACAISAAAVAESHVQHVRDCPQPSCAESHITRSGDGGAAVGSPASELAALDGTRADTPACCTAVTGSESSIPNAEDGEGAGDARAGRGQQQLLQALDSAGSLATASEAVAAAFSGGGAASGAQAGAAASSSDSSATAAGLVAGPGAGADSAATLGAASAGGFAAATATAFGTAAAAGQSDTTASSPSFSDPNLASSAVTSAPTHMGADGVDVSARRALAAAVYPSSATNGSASATFPSAAFGAWCAADAACAAAGSLNLTLLHYTDAASVAAITDAVLNWPSPLSAAAGSGLSVTGQALVSGVVELQLEAYPAKQNMPICSAASGSGSCAATLTIPLTSGAVDVTKSTACIRLEPTILGTGYQAVGYPTGGTDGTAVVGIIINNQLRCNTTKFGKHVIMQYRQTAAVPPSPPATSPPPPPAPPPPLNATGAVLTSEVQLKVKLVVGVSFDDLKASNSTLAQLKSSLESSLVSSLNSQVPALLLFSRSLASASSGTITRISRYEGATTTAVTVEFVIRVPAGATEAQVSALMSYLTSNTNSIFAGSLYASKFMGPAAVTRVVADDGAGISVGGAVGIALGCLAAFVLLLGGAYGLYRYRAYQALLPKRPDGDWDEYGLEVVQPRGKSDSSSGGRAARRERRAKPSAVVPMESEAAAVVPPPWAGANAPTAMEPAAAAGAPLQTSIPGSVVGGGAGEGPGAAGAAGGGGGGGGGAAVGGAGGQLSEGGGTAPGGGGGGGGPKSEADLRAGWG